uniref:Uncharacterized protein n=1 Tax=Anguilla anguilla TaxID=7936 RepID=A0A0E9UAH1_ANGAN
MMIIIRDQSKVLSPLILVCIVSDCFDVYSDIFGCFLVIVKQY